MKKSIQDYRKDATLDKLIRYEEGVMSRRQWLNLQRIKGATVKERTVRNYAAEEKLETWIFEERKRIPTGNPNWPETAHWLSEKERLKAGIYKTEYSLYIDDRTSFDITKTEYDYFQNMELAEDKATERMDLTYRIEAGIATNEEIQEDEDKEMEFFRKYC